MTMKKIILTTVLTISAMMLWSCGQHNSEASSINGDNDMDSTLCQFSNIDAEKMFYYIDDDGDTLYFDNSFSAFWPQIINGKECPELQQALFRAMTDSAELNSLDKVTEFLLNPSSYTEIENERLVPTDAVKEGEDRLSTSEIDIIMQSMNDRLLPIT